MIKINKIETIARVPVNGVNLAKLSVYVSKHLDYMEKLLAELGYEEARQDAVNHLTTSFLNKNKRLESIYYLVDFS